MTGRRAVPHTAGLRIQAWAATREECLAQAVLSLVESFADTARAERRQRVSVRLPSGSDDDLLADLLTEVIHRMDAEGELPVAAEVVPVDGAVEARFAVTDVGQAELVGATPKAVSPHRLRIGPDQDGWSCEATIDV